MFGTLNVTIRYPIGFHPDKILTNQTYGYIEPDFEGTLPMALAELKRQLPSATLVVANSGAWHGLAQTDQTEYFLTTLNAIESFAPSTASLVWRTTTAALPADKMVRKLLQERPRWHIVDANEIVNDSRTTAPWIAWDGGVHLHSFVYEELLRLIFGQLRHLAQLKK